MRRHVLLGVRVGRVEASLQSIELDGPFDSALTDQLRHLTLDRITAV
jgi:hypothetical protein